MRLGAFPSSSHGVAAEIFARYPHLFRQSGVLVVERVEVVGMVLYAFCKFGAAHCPVCRVDINLLSVAVDGLVFYQFHLVLVERDYLEHLFSVGHEAVGAFVVGVAPLAVSAYRVGVDVRVGGYAVAAERVIRRTCAHQAAPVFFFLERSVALYLVRLNVRPTLSVESSGYIFRRHLLRYGYVEVFVVAACGQGRHCECQQKHRKDIQVFHKHCVESNICKYNVFLFRL